MTEELAVLKQRHSELERRHSEVELRVESRFESILRELAVISHGVHDIKTATQLIQKEMEHVKSDIDSGKHRVDAATRELDDISSGSLQLRVEHDQLKREVAKWDLATLGTSVVAGIIAIWVVIKQAFTP